LPSELGCAVYDILVNSLHSEAGDSDRPQHWFR